MSTIQFNTEGHTGMIYLNRPEKFNSFNREMALELQSVLKECADNKNIRAVYLSGTGKAFCAGQDLSEAIEPGGPGIEKIVAEHYNPIILAIRQMEKPVLCAVNGVAAGAGANIALCCDIVVAAKSASFIQAFSKIGLIPDSGGTYFLPRLAGMQRAAAWMMLGDKITAEEAMGTGLVYKVYDDAIFEKESRIIADTLSGMPTRGLALTKKLLNETFGRNLADQLKAEGTMQTEAGGTYDFKEGVKAFLEKRKPVFRGE